MSGVMVLALVLYVFLSMVIIPVNIETVVGFTRRMTVGRLLCLVLFPASTLFILVVALFIKTENFWNRRLW